METEQSREYNRSEWYRTENRFQNNEPGVKERVSTYGRTALTDDNIYNSIYSKSEVTTKKSSHNGEIYIYNIVYIYLFN